MPKARPLNVEQLEDRCTPATFGVPWLDGTHLTISFAPDGTAIGNGSSDLFQMLDAQIGAPSVWEHEIVRAFQTWASHANLNIGVVSDNGQPLGTTGALQGQPGFGDIRIAAEALGANSVATSVPFNITAGTWSGDIILNSNYSFGVGTTTPYDLYSVIIHEAGHTLGIDDSPDPASPMFKNYLGVRVNLTNADIASVQALYGARQADIYDQQGPNNSFANAAQLAPFRDDNPQNLSINGDVTSAGETDFYYFRTKNFSGGMTIELQTSGFSLLTGRLSVYDSSQNLISSAVSTDPLNGDLVIRLNHVNAKSGYFIEVQGAATDVFSIGGYHLLILPDGGSWNNDGGDNSDDGDGGGGSQGNNHSYDTAVKLYRNHNPNDQRFTFSTQGNLASPSTADFYRFRTPGQQNDPTIPVMNVMVWAAPGSTLQPQISVYDSNRNLVASDILVNENGSYTVQVRNVTPHSRYYVVVQSTDPTNAANSGNYNLAVTFASAAVHQDTFASGTLTDANPQNFNSLQVNDSQLFHFVLSGSTGGASTPTAMRMTIYDQNGNVYFTMVVHDGETKSATLFMQPGTYTFRFAAKTKNGAPLPNWSYTLLGASLSDPIGPLPADPSGDPGGGNNNPPFVWGNGNPTGDNKYGDPWW